MKNVEFEKGDYIVNIDKLKAALFDELVDDLHGEGEFCAENELKLKMDIIAAIEKYGQKMG